MARSSKNNSTVADYAILAFWIAAIIFGIAYNLTNTTNNKSHSQNQRNYSNSDINYSEECPITTCTDGVCSSSTGRGTCSHHGGIRK